MMMTNDGRTRGFGFVTYVNTEDADKVLADDDLTLDGRKYVSFRSKNTGFIW